jgi:hypothetical protein
MRLIRQTFVPSHWSIVGKNLWFMFDMQRAGSAQKRHWHLKVGRAHVEWR